MCGKCCEAIRLIGHSEADFQHSESHPNSDFGFVRDHWREITADTAYVVNPLLKFQADAGYFENRNLHYFVCDVYDTERKRCGDHENRPSVCRTYPFDSHPQEPYDSLPYATTCGYNINMLGGECQVWQALHEEMRDGAL